MGHDDTIVGGLIDEDKSSSMLQARQSINDKLDSITKKLAVLEKAIAVVIKQGRRRGG